MKIADWPVLQEIIDVKAFYWNATIGKNMTTYGQTDAPGQSGLTVNVQPSST